MSFTSKRAFVSPSKLIGVVILCMLLAFSSLATAQQLPTTCHQGSGEVFQDIGGHVCGGGVCLVSWRAQIDWAAGGDVLTFDVRIDGRDQCLSSYGVLMDTSAQCTTTGFGVSNETLLSVTLAAFYQGGSSAVASWTYRGAGLECGALLRQPTLFDALLVSQSFELVIGAPVMATLIMVGAAPLPLSASSIECPLVPLSCTCLTGCAYDADVWAHNNNAKDVWDRSRLPDTLCGMRPVNWLAGVRATRAFPIQVADALVQWIATTLNTANFHCPTTWVPGDSGADAAVAQAYDAIRVILVEATQPSIVCMSDQHEWAPHTAVLRRFNQGGYANMSGPCSCAERECAVRYDATVGSASAPFIDHGAFSDATPGAALNANPSSWDTLTIVFFSVMLALACLVILLGVALAGVCLFSTFIGPRGFRPMGDVMPDFGANDTLRLSVHHDGDSDVGK